MPSDTCLTGSGWEGVSIRGRWSRAQLSVSSFSPVSSHLVSLAKFFFSPLCSIAAAVDTEGRLQTETFSGNTMKYQLPGQILGLGIFMLFCVYLGHLFLLAHSSQDLFTSTLSLRCLPQWSPTPTAQDGIKTSEGGTFIALGQLEFQPPQPYILIT